MTTATTTKDQSERGVRSGQSDSVTDAADAVKKSKQIAGLLGPILIPAAISEVVNLHIWATNFSPLPYLVGILWFVAGFSIVRTHNRWTASWPVAITVVGWFLVLGGLFRMFFPEAQQGNQNTPVLGTYAVNAVLAAIGVLLTLKAYWPMSARAVTD